MVAFVQKLACTSHFSKLHEGIVVSVQASPVVASAHVQGQLLLHVWLCAVFVGLV